MQGLRRLPNYLLMSFPCKCDLYINVEECAWFEYNFGEDKGMDKVKLGKTNAWCLSNVYDYY